MTTPPPTSARTEFRILGATEVWVQGVRIPLTAAKQRTVLAALLISPGRFVSDAWLAELLWGANPPATRTAQLYTYVSRLRNCCGPGLRVVRRHRGYHLVLGTAWFDWAAFQQLAEQGRRDLVKHRYAEAASRLESALRLWKGPALSDVTEFLSRTELPALEEARLGAIENRMAAVLALGRHVAALPELNRLVAEHPTRESLRGHLMVALYRSDRQMDALRVYEQGRRVLQEELGVVPGAALRALHRAVLLEELPGPAAVEAPAPVAAGIGLDAAPDCAPGPGTAPPRRHRGPHSPWLGLVPAMLPMDPVTFIGRRPELDGVLQELRGDGSGRRAVVLTGEAGAGTSALAVRAGHLCRDDFRQGQLYIDLRREGGGAKNPLEVLGCFLRALIPERGADLPETLDERLQLYRSALSRRRVLVVLDNAADARQVRPLLASGPGCRTLITGRRSLASLEGVRVVRVGRLGAAEAHELVATTVGAARLEAERDPTTRLLELCDGNPLALRFCAARLAARPRWPVARLVARLEQGEVRPEEWGEVSHEPLSALRSGVLELKPFLRPVLRTLARDERGVVTLAAAARRLGWTEERARTALDALVEAGLIGLVSEPDGAFAYPPGGQFAAPPSPESYRCSPLVRLLFRRPAAGA
ncbi:BTAD domain-containing putative transcriptional regulator [Streptomyces anulatus]